MKEIELTQGYVALVDDEDYEELSKYKWHARVRTSGPRAVRVPPREKGVKRKAVSMSRQIMNASPNMVVDHKDHDTLNNQRYNIRICTHAQNSANKRKQRGCSSKFKGVYWDSVNEKWRAQICVEGLRKNLGRFVIEVDAARAYNVAALEHFKEFALLNDLGDAA